MMREIVQRLRFISTISSTFSVEDIFKLLVARQKSFKVAYSLFLLVIKVYFKVVVRKMFEEGISYYLPSALGVLTITKKKTGIELDKDGNIVKKTFYLDRLLTKEHKGKKIYNMDIEYIVRFKWAKGVFKNRSMVYLNPTSKIRSRLWAIASSNNHLEINKYRDGK